MKSDGLAALCPGRALWRAQRGEAWDALREFAHILSTFPLVAEEVKSAAIAEFRKRSIDDANDRNP